MEDSTPIVELPNRAGGSGGGTENIPIAPTAMQPPPTTGQIDPRYMNRVIVGLQEANGATLGTLPTRDIPMNTLSIQQDEQIRANYVPSAPQHTRDYVSDYELSRAARAISTANSAAAASKKDKGGETSDWDDLLVPFLVGCLFFIFQMPTIQSVFYKYAPTMFHTSDGNLSNIGLLFKSVLFGAIYYLIMRFAKSIF